MTEFQVCKVWLFIANSMNITHISIGLMQIINNHIDFSVETHKAFDKIQ